MPEKRLLRNLDFYLIAAVVVLTIISLTVIASARSGFGDQVSFVRKQLIAAVLGSVIAAIILAMDYSDFSRYSTPIYAANLVLLATILVWGDTANGAQSWLDIGFFRFQPSEVAKVAIIITLANHLSKQERLDRWRDLIPPVLHIAPPMALIMLQPDLGTSLVFLAILFGMLFIAGAPPGRLLLIGGGGLAAVVTWVVLHLRYGVWIPLKDYQIMRLIIFTNPQLEPIKSGYHIIQSRIAIGSGGPFGKGLFLGTQNQLKFLPEQHTDFIFAVIGEELGFIGGIGVLALYFFVLYRGILIATRSKDKFGALIAVGIVSMIAFHVLVNVGMTMGIMPITGIPLPLMSYGGTSLLANLGAMGLLLNIYMRRKKILF